jgi:hypothetical protein
MDITYPVGTVASRLIAHPHQIYDGAA